MENISGLKFFFVFILFFLSLKFSSDAATCQISISAGGTTTFCTGSVLLSASPNSGATYQWKLNGNDITGATASTYSATSSGNYACAITNAQCGTQVTNVIGVTTGVTPQVSISGSNYIPGLGYVIDECNNYDRNLQALPIVTDGVYQWRLCGYWYNPVSTSSSNYSGGLLAGVWGVQLTTSCGTTTSDWVHLRIPTSQMRIYSSNGSSRFCSNSSTYLVVNPSNISHPEYVIPVKWNSYQWRLNGVPIYNGEKLYPTQTGWYSCKVTNSCGISCCIDSAYFIVDYPPSAIINTNDSTTICSGDSVRLIASALVGCNYQWLRNNIYISGATSFAYSATSTGSYKCTINSASCNSTSNSINVTVNPSPPAPSIVPAGVPAFCLGDSVMLSSSSATNNVWSTGDTTQVITVLTYGTYSVAVHDTLGCTSTSAEVPVTVNSSPLVPAIVSGNGHPNANAIGVSYSIPLVPDATSYTWTVTSGITITSGQGTQSITTDFAANFTDGVISVIANNDCGSSPSRTKQVRSLLNPRPSEPLPTSADLNSKFKAEVSNTIFSARIFPNPTSHHFTIQISSPDNSKCLLIIKDLLGREIERKENISVDEQINFGYHFTNGIYFAEVIQGNERKVLRLIKTE